MLDTASAEFREAARPIVNELCLLPLAVDQAGAAIRSGLSNIDDYLDIYSRRRQELLADPIFQGASNYGRAVYGDRQCHQTWKLWLIICNYFTPFILVTQKPRYILWLPHNIYKLTFGEDFILNCV